MFIIHLYFYFFWGPCVQVHSPLTMLIKFILFYIFMFNFLISLHILVTNLSNILLAIIVSHSIGYLFTPLIVYLLYKSLLFYDISRVTGLISWVILSRKSLAVPMRLTVFRYFSSFIFILSGVSIASWSICNCFFNGWRNIKCQS